MAKTQTLGDSIDENIKDLKRYHESNIELLGEESANAFLDQMVWEDIFVAVEVAKEIKKIFPDVDFSLTNRALNRP